VAEASGVVVLAWQNSLLQLILDPVQYSPERRSTDIAAAIHKHNGTKPVIELELELSLSLSLSLSQANDFPQRDKQMAVVFGTK